MNEAIDSMLKDGSNCVIYKLDIERAYDHIHWAFLFALMEKNGFWLEMDLARFNGAYPQLSFSVLVNGTPFGLF